MAKVSSKNKQILVLNRKQYGESVKDGKNTIKEIRKNKQIYKYMRKLINLIFSALIENNKANKLLTNSDIRQDMLAPILPISGINKKLRINPTSAELNVIIGIHLVCFKNSTFI